MPLAPKSPSHAPLPWPRNWRHSLCNRGGLARTQPSESHEHDVRSIIPANCRMISVGGKFENGKMRSAERTNQNGSAIYIANGRLDLLINPFFARFFCNDLNLLRAGTEDKPYSIRTSRFARRASAANLYGQTATLPNSRSLHINQLRLPTGTPVHQDEPEQRISKSAIGLPCAGILENCRLAWNSLSDGLRRNISATEGRYIIVDPEMDPLVITSVKTLNI